MEELPWAEPAVLCRRSIGGSATEAAIVMSGTLQSVAKKAGLMPMAQRQYLLVALPSRKEGRGMFEGSTLETLIGRERAGWRARRW